jgi:hypothetical protein
VPNYVVEFWQLMKRNLCLAGHLLPGQVDPSYVEFWRLMIRNLQLVSGWPPAAWPSWSFLCQVLAIDDTQLATCVWLATCCLAKLAFQWPSSPYMTTLSVMP